MYNKELCDLLNRSQATVIFGRERGAAATLVHPRSGREEMWASSLDALRNIHALRCCKHLCVVMKTFFNYFEQLFGSKSPLPTINMFAKRASREHHV